jgi:hypothetical protein
VQFECTKIFAEPCLSISGIVEASGESPAPELPWSASQFAAALPVFRRLSAETFL